GSEPIVGSREDRRLDPERGGEPRCCRGERIAAAEALRPRKMKAEIAVAEPEPRVGAERGGRLERRPGLARATPTALLVGDSGKRVEQRVQIGRNVKSEDLEVVADVADHRDIRRPEHVDEAEREARSSDAAGEEDRSHAATSASVSTSAARFGRSTGRRPSASNRAALPAPQSGSNALGR